MPFVSARGHLEQEDGDPLADGLADEKEHLLLYPAPPGLAGPHLDPPAYVAYSPSRYGQAAPVWSGSG